MSRLLEDAAEYADWIDTLENTLNVTVPNRDGYTRGGPCILVWYEGKVKNARGANESVLLSAIQDHVGKDKTLVVLDIETFNMDKFLSL